MSKMDLANQLTAKCLWDIWRPMPHPKVGFGYPLESPVLFIKAKDSHTELPAEAQTQQYAREKLLQMEQNKTPFIKIPQVYRIIKYRLKWPGEEDTQRIRLIKDVVLPDYLEVIEGGEGPRRSFLVMEYVYGKTLQQIMREDFQTYSEKEDEFFRPIATGISLLLNIPPPNNQVPGPVGGGLIRNPLFGEETIAPHQYRSVKEIEKHFNAVSLQLTYFDSYF